MVKTDLPYLHHILDAVCQIEQYVSKLDWPAFQSNDLVQDAVMRQIQVIGEAAKLVSADFKKKHPELPWAKMTGMRDKVVHGYFGVDRYLVWQTAVFDIPRLKNFMRRLVEEFD